MQFSDWKSAGQSNPNLLINWDFREPVNQRGKSTYNSTGYTLDMWVLGCSEGGGYVEILPDCVKLVNYGSWINFYSIIEKANHCANKTITFSAKIKGKAKLIINVNNNYIVSKSVDNEEYEIASITYDMPSEVYAIGLLVQPSVANEEIMVQATKIEVGSISTLYLDLMQPPNYPEELKKCQRYLYVSNTIANYNAYFGSGTSYNWETRFVPIAVALPENMRAYPSIYSSGDIRLFDKISGDELEVNGIYTERGAVNGMIELMVTADGVIGGHEYILTSKADANARIFFSAEL